MRHILARQAIEIGGIGVIGEWRGGQFARGREHLPAKRILLPARPGRAVGDHGSEGEGLLGQQRLEGAPPVGGGNVGFACGQVEVEILETHGAANITARSGLGKRRHER